MTEERKKIRNEAKRRLTMSLLDEITLDDLDEKQREFAECIGLEAYKRLVVTYAGCTICVRMPKRLTMRQRNRKIQKDFNGGNMTELAKSYGLSERQIRNIVAVKKYPP